MGTGWRRAFCTTIHRDRRENVGGASPSSENANYILAGSNPSTPRLRCKTGKNSPENNIEVVGLSPKVRLGSNQSSPRSPFSILRNTLRLSRNNCGVCRQSVKTGQGTAIFTAECSHAFHFPCIASHVRQHRRLICPVCTAAWKDVPLLAAHAAQKPPEEEEEKDPPKQSPVTTPKSAKHYADDEPLVTPKASGANFLLIMEEEDSEDKFRGFFANPVSSSDDFCRKSRGVEVTLSPEVAVVSQGRGHGTCAAVLKVRAPPLTVSDTARRAPIDLVAVLDVGGTMVGPKLEMLKRAVRLVVSSLGPADRLSVIAFAAAPRRLLPLRRMTPQGQSAARRAVDRLGCSHGCSVSEALKLAARVLEERRERNPVASIILLSDGQDDAVPANSGGNQRRGQGSSGSTRFAHVEIPVHSSGSGAEDAFSKCVSGLLSVVVQDLRIQIGFAAGSDPAEITGVYSCGERPILLGSSCIRVGDLYAEEEKELLVEIGVPETRVGSHIVLSTRCSYKDPGTGELIYGRDRALLLPRPQTFRSGSPGIERLRNVFISRRALAESRRLIELQELSSAMQLLSSARALVLQSRSESAVECVRNLETGMSEVQRRAVLVDENGVPLTPTSAWRAAEKLARVAQMNKALNRVSDLHGFENARF
ncbi:Zinc finger (C3HC4-type RING finger) family protein [Striga hermonthica]|uniref:Zinc finger (C3HC4-type RING finger) family protein n=1 Tax=Striga hermonthica TaxID=68872 RepID=A0A9N7NQB8_STRHE|nr:Zinc finger (C3HC4-type RING finger) family protein [Striga hermonthica]